MKVTRENHPLDPLSAEELKLTVQILKRDKGLDDHYRLANISLLEPAKSIVLDYRDEEQIDREAFCIILHNKEGKTYEAVVSLTEGSITSWKLIPGVQPSIMADEFMECQEVVKSHPEMIKAFAKRGAYEYGQYHGRPMVSREFWN
ncbi:hypothetical protein RCO48_37365 [Peribacillus frigoritolerans]|nr:hypothetical protein [Peribacillus frigoritolerans]